MNFEAGLCFEGQAELSVAKEYRALRSRGVHALEEILVGVANGDEIVWVQHAVPEHFAGNNLTESEAQALALGRLSRKRAGWAQSSAAMGRVDAHTSNSAIASNPCGTGGWPPG